MRLVRLSSVQNSYKMKVLPEDVERYLPNYGRYTTGIRVQEARKLPVLYHNRNRKISVAILTKLYGLDFSADGGELLSWYSQLDRGDSGQAIFVPINGELVLVGYITTSSFTGMRGGGVFVGQFLPTINSQIQNDLGLNEQVETVDLSGFPTYE